MSHADPWAARYGFLRELWSGRARVLADPALEAALRGVKALPASLAALLAELLPVGAGGKSWLLSYDVKPGPARPRSQVAAFDAFEDVLVEAPWQVAIVDLARHFVDAATLSRFAARARTRLENRLDTRAFRLLAALAEGAEAGRVVVVSAPGEAAGGLDLAQFQELVTQHFPRARVYAQAAASVATVIDCGEVTSDEEEDEEEDERGPLPLAYDNSLADEPRYAGYIAVVGAREAPRGVTIVEVPPVVAPAPAPTPAPAPPARARAEAPRGRGEEEEALRGQLAQARRQLELASIARQSLVEQLDAAQARIDALEDRLAGRQDAPTEQEPEADEPAPVERAPERTDLAAAQLQSVRWELEQAQAELRRLTARPVEALERGHAEAQARLAAAAGCVTAFGALLAEVEPTSELHERLKSLHDRLRGALGAREGT